MSPYFLPLVTALAVFGGIYGVVTLRGPVRDV